ncbi:MAG: restriction endonuclease subunit S [Bacteroidota bacterium]|nr:restriction endonuclease subunit S [Bacteroidota bacterium]
MTNSWEETTLKDICVKITDGAHASPKSVDDGLPMASVKDLTPYGINLDSCRLISESDFDSLVKYGCKPEKGDILVAKDGATALDTVCEVKNSINVVLLSSVAILRPNTKKVTSSFLRYYMDSPVTRNYLKGGFITGAAIPRIVLEDFKRSKIVFPSIKKQNEITSILSAYDDLIENNSRRIKILEEMAKLIYREWFVEFNPPAGRAGAPGVKLRKATVEEKKVTGKDQFPEGWEVKKLGDFIELAYGKGLKSEKRSNDGYPVYGSSGVIGHHQNALVKGPGIIVGRKGNVGSVFWCNEDFYPIDTVFFVRTNISLYYIFYNLSNQTFLNSDAAVPGLNRESALMKVSILPDKNLIDNFERIVTSIFKQIKLLETKNQNLRRTRDLLLPKLVSGEIEV